MIYDEDDWLRPLQPLNEIRPGLWMGGMPKHLPDHIVAVVDCCGGMYAIPPHVIYVRAMFEDSTTHIPDRAWLESIADTVLALSRLGPVLVHCQAGLNRSGIVVALALMRDGMSSNEAVALIRRQRDATCLCNSSFVAWLARYSAVPEPHAQR